MRNDYLLTITDEEGTSSMEIPTSEAVEILASFRAIDCYEGTLAPNKAQFWLLDQKMKAGEPALFFYDDCVTGKPVDGKIERIR